MWCHRWKHYLVWRSLFEGQTHHIGYHSILSFTYSLFAWYIDFIIFSHIDCMFMSLIICFHFIQIYKNAFCKSQSLLSTVYCRYFFNIKNSYIKYKKEESYFLSFTNVSMTFGETSTVNSSFCMEIPFMKLCKTHSQHAKIINS